VRDTCFPSEKQEGFGLIAPVFAIVWFGLLVKRVVAMFPGIN